jgi:hypothetical protein
MSMLGLRCRRSKRDDMYTQLVLKQSTTNEMLYPAKMHLPNSITHVASVCKLAEHAEHLHEMPRRGSA